MGRFGRPGRLEQHHPEGRAVASSRPSTRTKEFQGDQYGRVLHFGIREHAHGLGPERHRPARRTRPYGGTFLVFSDYMRPAVRLAALMKLPVTYVWTHDSIGLGEDGPTHQPIEHLAALRAIPGLDVVRPADANETAAAWADDPRAHRPPGRPGADPAERADVPARHGRLRRPRRTSPRAATCCSTRDGTPDVILIGTGSEVQLAVEARATAGRRGHRRPGRLDAVPRVVRRAGRRLPRLGDPGRRPGPGLGRGRRSRWAGATSSATPAAASASSTTAPRPTTRPCTTSSASPPTRSSQAAKDSIAAAAGDQRPRRAARSAPPPARSDPADAAN